MGVRRKEMKIGEVRNQVSYQGQGSSVKTETATEVKKDSEIVDF